MVRLCCCRGAEARKPCPLRSDCLTPVTREADALIPCEQADQDPVRHLRQRKRCAAQEQILLTSWTSAKLALKHGNVRSTVEHRATGLGHQGRV